MLCRTLLLLLIATINVRAVPWEEQDKYKHCQYTSVAILGAGTAGIVAAQTLANQSIHDFVILEYNADIGGRIAHTNFGKKPDGTPYVVELGANWVQGLGSPDGPENPVWTLVKRYNVTNTYSNYSSILTYDQTGFDDYSQLLADFEDSYSTLEQDAGYILTDNLQDRSTRSGLTLAGWTPRMNMAAQAVDWWEWDFEYAFSPEQSSQEFGIVNYNASYYQWSEANNYVFDQRGFNTFLKGLASTFLRPGDPRLRLNTIVTNVTYTSNGVTIQTANKTCIRATHAITTFSLGVLQAAIASPPAAPVSFSPAFPAWKNAAIASFNMGIYTKIFLQFDLDHTTQFWDPATQFFLYASPTTRGYYPIWQSLASDGFLPDSGILFVTVVDDQSRRVERQTDAQTLADVMAVLREMFGAANVPDPVAFMYPRWGQTEWAFGSYSNWPVGVTLEEHQNLRANLGNLWFAGEHTSAEYFGFIQGAYYEGQDVGNRVATCLKRGSGCPTEQRYEVLHGTTPLSEYTVVNGWDVSTFST